MGDATIATLRAGEGRKRTVVRRVECTGAGYARIEQTITRRGSRPLNKQGSYRTADGTIVYPRNGYYYTRNPDGSLTKGQGTYQDGVPCPDCLKITPVTPEGIIFDPIDWTVDFNPAVLIDIEMAVPEMPAPEQSEPVPDWDMDWAARDSSGCDSYDPFFTAEEVAYRNERFLRIWTATGMAGDDTDNVRLPELTKEEYLQIRQRILDGGTTDYHLFTREWPTTVRWGKRGEIDIDNQCVDPVEPGETSYIICLPTNDPDVTGGDGAARMYGSLIIEIRYVVPNLYLNGQIGWSYVVGQKHYYNVTEDVVEPCDPWTLLEDETPVQTDTDETPDLTNEQGPDVPTDSPTDVPTDTPPVDVELPPCIRQMPDRFEYCPPVHCAPAGATTSIVKTEYEYRHNGAGYMIPLASDVSAFGQSVMVWIPDPQIERRPVGNAAAEWSVVDRSDYSVVPKHVIEQILALFPENNDPALNLERQKWLTLLETAPLSDDWMLYSPLADLGLLPHGGMMVDPTMTQTPITSDTQTPTIPAVVTVCYEARLSLDPYPRWYANIAGRWIEIEACCPKPADTCCDETRQELSNIRSMIANLTEIVLRREAGEQTPVVDLSNIERELAEIRQRLDAQPPSTQYDDTRILTRIDELEQIVRESRTPAYDDSGIRMGIEEIKALVNQRCERCQPGTNYDARFDEVMAILTQILQRPEPQSTDYAARFDNLDTMLRALVERPIGGEGDTSVYDVRPELAEIATLIRNLRFATGNEYDQQFDALRTAIANIRYESPDVPQYDERFDRIDQMLAEIKETSTKNYDAQFSMLASMIQDLQSRQPVNYDDRFTTLEQLISNIRVTQERDYTSRFDRLESLIASLTTTYPRYDALLNEIKVLIESMRQTTTNTQGSTTTSSSSSTTSSPCGGTTVNCGGANDVRFDLILDQLYRLRETPQQQTDLTDAINEIVRQLTQLQTTTQLNTDRRFDEVRMRLDQLAAELATSQQQQAQTQTQTQTQSQNSTTNITTPTAIVDPRIDEVQRLLNMLQATTGTMSSTLMNIHSELATTRSNYENLKSVYEEYIRELQTKIRTDGSASDTYQVLEQAQRDYEFQDRAYQTVITDLQSRIARMEATLPIQQVTTTTVSPQGTPRMVERHERVIYDYPSVVPQTNDDECSDCI